MKKLMNIATIVMMTSSGIAFAQAGSPTNSGLDSFDKSNTTGSVTSTARTAEQDKWWHDRDLNNDGKLSRSEYVKAETKNSKKSVREATNEFNKEDTDKDGYINASEFKAWFEKLGDKVSSGAHELKNDTVRVKEKVKEEYRESDMNHNGK